MDLSGDREKMMKTLRELDIFDLGELVLLPHSCVLLP